MKFNIKEQTSNSNTQQEKIHLKETSNRFKTPSKIHEDNEFTGHLFPFIIYEGLFNGGGVWNAISTFMFGNNLFCGVSNIKYFIIWYKGINVVWIQKAVDLKAEQSVVLMSASIVNESPACRSVKFTLFIWRQHADLSPLAAHRVRWRIHGGRGLRTGEPPHRCKVGNVHPDQQIKAFRSSSAAPRLCSPLCSPLLRYGPRLCGEVRADLLPRGCFWRGRSGCASGRDFRQPEPGRPLLWGFSNLHGLGHYFSQFGVVGAVVHGQRPAVRGQARLTGYQLYALGQEAVREVLQRQHEASGSRRGDEEAEEHGQREGDERDCACCCAVSGYVGRQRARWWSPVGSR